ncbi:sensor histidine kinase [Haloarchaeobius sp. DFWS5]|uniref:sensor histidine kinase n=1 Tax=Haloarchaeobius sp. DFWS5 TaxID=3446114 RepID=UPI003EBBF847
MTLTALVLVQFLGAAFAIALAVYAFRRRDRPGIIWLVAVLVGDTVWMISAGLNYATSSLAVSRVLLQVRYVGITVVPVAILFFALSYTGYDGRLSRRHRVLVALPAVAALLLALTDSVHGLFYASVTPASNPQHVAYRYGAVAVPWIVYAFLLTVSATAAFVRYALVAEGVYRWQALTLAVAVSLGIVADVVYFLPIPPNGFAITPLSILFSCMIGIAIVLQYDFVRLIPATRELGRKELIERMELGMLVVNADGRVVDVNPAAAQVLGRSVDQLLGEQAPDDLPDLEGPNIIKRTFTVEGVDRDFEIRTNRVGGASGITLITFQQLEDLAGMMSHDLQGPLMEIRGSADMAISSGDITHVESVLTAANRIDQLVDDVLELAQTGRDLGDRRPIELASLADAAWMHVWSPDSTLTVETDQTVLADPSRVQQLFENLFQNSVEHGSPSTERQIDGEARGEERDSNAALSGQRRPADRGFESKKPATGGVHVTVGSLPDGFYVEDTGPGISQDEPQRIFERGYSNSPGGTGFGLAIVREITRAHGWSVRASEGSTGGARFEITDVEFTTAEGSE